MKKAWRIVRTKRLSDAFSGEGSRRGGGRWNHTGTQVVYVSENLSLAVLEQFVHFTRYDIGPARNLVVIPVEIPETVKIIEISLEDLNVGWRTSPPPVSTRDIGTRWIDEGKTAVLRVPSAIIPEEFNLVLNPNHRDFKNIFIGKDQPLTLDGRMWK